VLSGCVTPLRAAFIGVGRIAGLFAPTDTLVPRTHAQAMQRNGIDIVAVYDADEARAISFTNKWGGKHCLSLGKLLNDFPGLDIVVISSPDGFHSAQAVEILSTDHSPRLLIIEKPPAITLAELKHLQRVASACTKTRVVVNMSRRFDPCHAEAAAIIKSGELGSMVSAHFTYYGGWLHNGVHAVDILRYLLEDEIDIVSVQLGADGSDGDPCLNVEAVLRRDPSVCVSFLGFDECFFQLFELELRFSEGRIRFEDFGNRILVENVEINDIGERELGLPRVLAPANNGTAMDLLYGASRQFLYTGELGALDRVAMHQVAKSMQVIYDAIDG